MRRFEFSEGGSQKFWEIAHAGNSFTVRFGRIGTAGQEKTTACASADEALAEVAKLVREKVKKGYQEIGAAATWRPPAAYGRSEHIPRFMNYLVTGFNPDGGDEESGDEAGGKSHAALRELDRRVYRVGIGYDDQEEVFLTRLRALLADSKAGQLRGLVLGNWFGEISEEGPDAVIDALVAAKGKLGALEGIFFGDVGSEEAEISWLKQTDHGPLLRALPQLREYVVRGGDGLRFSSPLSHPSLSGLTVQSGGLSSACVRDLAAADLPELRRLTLWLGSDNYGGDATVADLRPILDGAVFPKLEFLALADSERADELAVALADAPVLDRLKGLDLSMGTLSDVGGLALLANPRIPRLKYLNLRHHYLSEGVMKRIRQLGIEVDLSDAEGGGDEDDRYCEVSE